MHKSIKHGGFGLGGHFAITLRGRRTPLHPSITRAAKRLAQKLLLEGLFLNLMNLQFTVSTVSIIVL
jgi:hypothetical protein